jgi:hypothetical protein
MSLTLVLSPESYPWDLAKEKTFLEQEVEVLARTDAKLVLLPQRTGGERLEVPAGVEVDDSLARETAVLSRRHLIFHAAQTTLVAEEALRRGRELRNPVNLKRVVEYAGRTHHAMGFAKRYLARRGWTNERVVFASTWWGPITTGFGLAARGLPRLRVVSRAHGFDLYEDRHTPPYQPCRHRALASVHGLFPDSDTGTNWLKDTYRSVPRKTETARLGIFDPHVVSRPSSDGVLRVVTCSLQVAVKRLDLLIDGLAKAGAQGARIEWAHHGTGPLQPALEEQARRVLPPNVKATFVGYSTQQELYRWYADHPVDVFVNVSSSEGTPVAAMEAIACGIPMLVTSVGGNPEICRPENGVRVSANPSAEEVGAALLRFASAEAQAWRAGSLKVWRERYDAEANFRAWFDTLKSV